MKGMLVSLVVAAVALSCGPVKKGDSIVIENVTVISGTGNVIPAVTVIIEGKRISRIIDQGVASGRDLHDGTKTIDGSGKFLIPGLFEMHAHTSKTRASALGLYIVNGVTTVRDMGGDHEELLQWREEIRSGDRVGPRLLIAGPYLESESNVERVLNTPPNEMVEPVERTRIPVGSVAAAHRVVDSLAQLEIDYLKVRTVTSFETFKALNEAADRNSLDLVGHTMGMTPEQILEAGHDGIEHFILPRLVDRTRSERMQAWESFADAGIFIVPTLVTFTEHAFPSQEELQTVVDDSLGELDFRRQYLSKYLLLDWQEQVLEASEDRQTFFKSQWPIELEYLREMHEASLDILTGSDVAAVNIFPGWSLPDEMILFQDSVGMAPEEVLERATRLPAFHLGLADSVGTIEEGKIADLVLLEGNPLADIANVKKIAAVIVRGKLFDRDALDLLLADVALAPDRRVNDWPRTGWLPRVKDSTE